jgi:hypothetical protein
MQAAIAGFPPLEIFSWNWGKANEYFQCLDQSGRIF